MKPVLLIDICHFYGLTENLGVASICSFLRDKNYDVSLLSLYNWDLENKPEAQKKYAEEIAGKYSLVGMSMFFTNADLIYQLSREIKLANPECRIFCGGRLASDAYVDIFNESEDIDYIILGDGEIPVLNLVRVLEEGSDVDALESVVTRNNYLAGEKLPAIYDMKEVIWPARDFLKYNFQGDYYTARIYMSRGCCGNCSFCSFNSYSKKRRTKCWIGRDISDVLQEVKYLYDVYGIRSFTVNDGSIEDPGVLGKERLKQFCSGIFSMGIKATFFAFIRAETFKSEKAEDVSLLKTMKQAGFVQLYVGIETANEKELKLFRKRATIKDNLSILSLLEDIGFETSHFGFIFLTPFSDRNTIRDNIEFLKEARSPLISRYIEKVWLLYETDLHHIVRQAGLLMEDFNYKTPLNYVFEDPYVQKIDDFYEAVIRKSRLMQYDYEIIKFIGYYSSMKFIFEEQLADIIREYNVFRNEYSKELYNYFKIIYYDQDLERAISAYDPFLQRCTDLMQCFNLLKLKMMRKKEIREYTINMKKRGNVNG